MGTDIKQDARGLGLNEIQMLDPVAQMRGRKKEEREKKLGSFAEVTEWEVTKYAVYSVHRNIDHHVKFHMMDAQNSRSYFLLIKHKIK